MMYRINICTVTNSMLGLVPLLTAVLLLPFGNASAKDHTAKQSANEARVVAHISFSGLSTVDMTLHTKGNDQYYLYVQHRKDEGVSIVDVGKPARARSLGVIPWPDTAVSSRMVVTGDLAIISESETLSWPGGRSTDLVLWDLSNPAVPRVVQRFAGVIKWLQDDRKFIYVLNGEGLWVVSEPVDHPSEQTESLTFSG